MTVQSINIDTAYTSQDALEWKIEHGGSVVASGISERRPDQSDVTIYPNRVVEDLLWSTFPEEDGVTNDPDASGEFVLKDGDGNTLETYLFVNATEPLAGDPAFLSKPVNGHADPRQLIMFTRFTTTADNVTLTYE